MTDLGAAQAGERIYSPPPPRPQLPPVGRPAGATADPVFAGQPSRTAAREAALAALSAARYADRRSPWPTAAVAGSTPPPGEPRLLTASAAPPVPGNRRGRFGGLRVCQVLCWQLVAVAVVLAADRPWPLFGAVVVVALAVMASTTLRLRGRWLYEWLVMASEYSLRDRDQDLRSAGEAGQALLRLVSPEAVGITDQINDDTVFMLSRAAGITAVLQPKSTGRDPAKAMPAPETLLPPPHEQALGIAVQVVHHAGPNRQRPPRVWVALQALRTVEIHQDDDVRRALGNTVRRVQRQFRRDRLPVRALAEDEVLGALASLAQVTAGRVRVREEWRLWHSGPISHATFRLDGWAELSPEVASRLVRWLLTAAPQAAVTIAVTARRPAAATETRIDATLRIATTDPLAVEHAVGQLAQPALEWGVALERLDGRHSQGMAATLPIGVA